MCVLPITPPRDAPPRPEIDEMALTGHPLNVQMNPACFMPGKPFIRPKEKPREASRQVVTFGNAIICNGLPSTRKRETIH